MLGKLWKLLDRNKQKIDSEVENQPVVEKKAKANGQCVKAMVCALKTSGLSDRMPRLRFNQKLAVFPKEVAEATEAYLATKGVLYGDAGTVGIIQGFFNCERCASGHIAENWHERSYCEAGCQLKRGTHCGKVCHAFIPRDLAVEWSENWVES